MTEYQPQAIEFTPEKVCSDIGFQELPSPYSASKPTPYSFSVNTLSSLVQRQHYSISLVKFLTIDVKFFALPPLPLQSVSKVSPTTLSPKHRRSISSSRSTPHHFDDSLPVDLEPDSRLLSPVLTSTRSVSRIFTFLPYFHQSPLNQLTLCIHLPLFKPHA